MGRVGHRRLQPIFHRAAFARWVKTIEIVVVSQPFGHGLPSQLEDKVTVEVDQERLAGQLQTAVAKQFALYHVAPKKRFGLDFKSSCSVVHAGQKWGGTGNAQNGRFC